jgi:hypothetical protein
MNRWILMIIGLATSGIAEAHHSIAGAYDSTRQITIEAVITNFQFVNPHPFLVVDARRAGDTTQQTQQWKLEMDNRRELTQIGMTGDTLKPGDRIVVTGHQGRDQSQNLYVYRLDRPSDGFRYEQIGSSPRIRPGR